jgi:molybdopterin-guanine dinucleotide biosynthesis protein A
LKRPISIAGLVLAGGRSSRFGADKALARFGERTLLQLSLERFAPCAARAVSVRGEGEVADHARALGAHIVEDQPSTASGPLAGIAAGLVWASAHQHDILAVAPCDLPLLRWDHYQQLLAGLGNAPAALATNGYDEQPLCSVWRSELASELKAALAGGAHSAVHGLLRSKGGRSVVFHDTASFANANTTADLALIASEAAL